MDRPVAKVHPLDDVPRSLSFQLNGNGNPWPNPNDSGPDPKGGLSTVTSEYATPGYDEDDFSEFINYDPDGQAVDIMQENGRNVTPSSAVVGKSGLHIVTTEGSPKLSISTRSQLLSPESTNNPSPASAQKDDNSYANVISSLKMRTQDRNTNLLSPTVKIDDCSGVEMPPAEKSSRIWGGGEHTGVCSPSHPSPLLQNPWTGNETVDELYCQTQQNSWHLPTVQRNSDGSWLRRSANGPSGFDPKSRTHIGNRAVPTLAEQDEQRHLAAKKSEVAEWLSHSQTGANTGIDAGNVPSSAGREAPSEHLRAQSPGEATVRQRAPADFVSPKVLGFDVSIVPGSSVAVDEFSDDEEDSDKSSDEEAMISATIAALKSYRINGEVKAEMPPAQDNGYMEPPFNTRFWGDPPTQPTTSETRYQPDTSNDAIMRLYERNKDIETASRTATIASSQRRLSEPDLDGIYKRTTKPKHFSGGKDKDKIAQKRDRRPSVIDSILRRGSSNTLKRKGSHPAQVSHVAGMTETGGEYSQNNFPGVRRNGPLALSPLDTNIAAAPRHRRPVSPIPSLAHTSPFAQITNAIRRSRSRSDMHKPEGLAALMTQHGGPPVPTLATRPTTAEQSMDLQAYPQSDQHDQGVGEGGDKGVAEQSVKIDLATQVKLTAPNLDGFKLQIRQHGPLLPTTLVERIAREQMARYERLADLKIKHLAAVRLGDCSHLCASRGASPRILPLPSSKKGSESSLVGYRIQNNAISEQKLNSPEDATLAPAQFPLGIPLPPVRQLPAEFECTLCFKVKKIMKPSDWTKHVLEDVQPFTCGFFPCREPKSFKRKADWVRHEDESHRHLESWVCSEQECGDVRHRKENFVQHLVRVHNKISLPEDGGGKIRVTSSNEEADSDNNQPECGSSSSPEVTADATQGGTGDIATLLRTCHRESTQSSLDEPCRFCGKGLGSWKKLTVHLAKHMEQISMSVLDLINDHHDTFTDDHVTDEAATTPIAEGQEECEQHFKLQGENIVLATPPPQRSRGEGRIAVAAPSWHSPVNSGYDSLQSVSISSVAAATAHSFPPPQMPSYDMPAAGQGYMIKPNNSLDSRNRQRVLSAISEWPMAPGFRQEASGLQMYPIAPSGQSYPHSQMGQNHLTSPSSQSYPPVGINHSQHRANNHQAFALYQQATQLGPSSLMVAPATSSAEPEVYLSPMDTIPSTYGLELGCLGPDAALTYAQHEGFSQYAQVQQNQIPVYSPIPQSYPYAPQ